ncbi:MAG: 16S rRNA (adenine(1518)-N(6)/adenine(1519)-N(6))-dimethyltransferase RsmA [Bacteroidetes bacterium]|nr:16S rRNA (adenine(1518)-N(6)/adenine(1519)-N(6))-dimethyltransferase RsmA [Bacteroidota bacterium]
MLPIKPKKRFGQHFLIDKNIASKIVNQLTLHCEYDTVLEIGPGLGILTEYLLRHPEYKTFVIEIDPEITKYLKERFKTSPKSNIQYPISNIQILEGDFLKLDLSSVFKENLAIIGNFPYNISSQIFFKILEHREKIVETVCMLQKEVAQRIASKPGNKQYGILSVLLQAFYDVELLFDVNEHVFEPKPKVKSAVIRLRRIVERIGNPLNLQCDEELFFKVVKQGFQNRRKTLRNALKRLILPANIHNADILNKRAEQLSVNEFIELTNLIKHR